MLANVLNTESIKKERTEFDYLHPEIKYDPRRGISPFTIDSIPVKVERVAILIYENIEKLTSGNRIYIPRKKVRQGMKCKLYVSDTQILNIIKDKMSIVTRENLYGMKNDHFKGGILKAGWEKNIITKEDEDRIIYIEFIKPGKDSEMTTLSVDECVHIKC